MGVAAIKFAYLLFPAAVLAAQELDKLQGTWVGIAATVRGKPVGKEVKNWKLEIVGTKLIRSDPDGIWKFRIIKIDPRSLPTRLEYRDHPDNRAMGLRILGNYKCVYSLDGETLTLSIASYRGDGFPAKIDKDNPDYLYSVWKKAKQK